MPILERTSGHQGRDIVIASVAQNETLLVTFGALRSGAVQWGNGGVSWTVDPAAEGDEVEYTVEHSLAPEGDYWSPDAESPFDEPTQGIEEYRIERIRFRNIGANAIRVALLSSAKFTSDLS